MAAALCQGASLATHIPSGRRGEPTPQAARRVDGAEDEDERDDEELHGFTDS